ncbi:MAG TPA: Flp pilus assembly complex ATPase component TadA [Firmicutes bacterium]|nr:Flp pilus assembly complex ATPase component TadA [Bacillota bacterium]
MTGRKRLGDILIERGLLDEHQLQQALEDQRTSGDKLGDILVRLGFITAEKMADALSVHLGYPRVDLARQYIAPEVVELVSDAFLKTHEILPLEVENNILTVAMTDPLNIFVIDELQRITGMSIQPMIATAGEIQTALSRAQDIASTARKVFDEYADPEQDESPREEEDQHLGDAPGVRLANMILEQAVRENASDIHLEPTEEAMEVRFRVDGILRPVMTVPKRLRSGVQSRIKVMANLDITERRRPQDGRLQLKVGNHDVDMRVSTLPTIHGEKIVARVLNRAHGLLKIEELGFSPQTTEQIRRILRLNQGLILVTGPTGSGKTTTLYGFLSHLNSNEKNIITIEDPVEYQLEGINQVQVNPKVNLTFATGLRSMLRQDPDVIMVGEIRDKETAEIAVRSALTGHLVLSTLHTNHTVATIARLMDMGIEPYLISSTVSAVISQRLVRKVCPDCRQAVPLTDPVVIRFIKSLNMAVPEQVYQGTGCPLCNDTGYHGRAAVEEVLLMNKKLRQAVDHHAGEDELKQIAVEAGMVTLQENAVNKLIAGITSVEEIIRTVYSIDEQEALE